MRSFPLITLILLAALSGRAQDTTWYTVLFKTTIRENAHSYRVKVRTDSGCRTASYYMTGRIISTSSYSDDSCHVAQGERCFYNATGIVTVRRNYKAGKLNGIETYYHDNGNIWATGNNLDGQPEGEWKSWHLSGKPAGISQFAGGKQVSARFFNENGNSNDKVDSFFRAATYPGGNAALRSYLQRQVRYPDAAKRIGIEGYVVVQFKVSKEGKLTDIEVVKSVESSLDKEACRVLRNLDDWEPALIGGLPVESTFKLPVSFRLSN